MNQKEKTAAFINSLNSRDTQAFKQLVHPDYIQHNPHIKDGRAALIGLFPVLEQHGTKVETLRIISDGKYVAMHNRWTGAVPFGADTVISFDVIRFDEEGLIAEHWDALMPNTSPNPSGRTLVDGSQAVENLAQTEDNKKKVEELFQVIISGDQEKVGATILANFQPDYKQHNPSAGDGVEAIFKAFAKEEWVYHKNHKVIGEGNFVLSISEGTAKGTPTVFYDLLRFENGKVAEHWDVIQSIPTEKLANNNSMLNF
ncbi:MAG: nuclear transport factor 2 family protein [Bacteroidia bacterium]|nr:nuclear transport factor 2 family protein [Bacteroidia bacterium]